jgi:nitroreductase
MTIDDIIRARRSVRRYRPDPVPRPLLEEVLELAQWAPSAVNRQPWHFVVLAGEMMPRLSAECEKSFEPLAAHLQGFFAQQPDAVERVRTFFRTLGGAPAAILAYCTAQPPTESDMESVAAAVQTLLLAAQARGLATCWMTGPRFREEQISALVGMEGARLVAVIPIGYPDEQPKPPPRQPGRVTYVGFESP